MNRVFLIFLMFFFTVKCCAMSGRPDNYSVPGLNVGQAAANIANDAITLKNEAISCSWSYIDGALKLSAVENKLLNQVLDTTNTELFEIVLDANNVIKSSDMSLAEEPKAETIQAVADSAKLSNRFSGKKITAIFVSKDKNLQIQWEAALHDESNYIIQSLKIESLKKDVYIEKISAIEFKADDANVFGEVSGSPVVLKSKQMFFAMEHPLADNAVKNGIVRCEIKRNNSLSTNQPLIVSWVIGVYPDKQLRRGFQYYVQRERAYPYRSFLHYNSWFDIAYHDRIMNEKQCLDRIEKFGQRFIKPYNVNFKSFVFDDGWDNHESLWRFNDGFPQGFTNIAQLAKKYNSNIGVWLSPWGGYSTAKKKRLEYGKQQGFEINKSGFSLSGPKYYDRFRQVCLDMIKNYGVNNFKFDGIAAGSRASSAGDYIADVESLLKLSGDLRNAKPDIFINMTTGTWPSPYWLWYGDSIWRQGKDWWTLGQGSVRQQWLTYRDSEVYERIVSRAPLFPLNSLMLHGIIFAEIGWGAKMPQQVDMDLEDEIWSFFGSGTALQELYMTPELMNKHSWSILAKAANWANKNADVLVDTHWIGGSPAKAEVYGWASYSNKKGILTIRNPSSKPQTFNLKLASAFEIPDNMMVKYALINVKNNRKAGKVSSDEEHIFKLKPFEVIALEAVPAK